MFPLFPLTSTSARRLRRAVQAFFALIRQAAPIAAPVMIGYFTVGATFGLTAAQAGFGWVWPLVISLVQFAGAAQFMIVAMVSQGAALTEIAAVVFLLNLRHVFYGLPFLARRPRSLLGRLLMIFWLTDETYSLLTTRKQADPPRVQIAVGGLNYASWAAGTLVGSVIGQILPLQIDSFAFALSALFAILLTEQLRSHRSLVPVLVGFAAALLILPVELNFGLGMFVTGLIAIALITVWHVVLVRGRRQGSPSEDPGGAP